MLPGHDPSRGPITPGAHESYVSPWKYRPQGRLGHALTRKRAVCPNCRKHFGQRRQPATRARAGASAPAPSSRGQSSGLQRDLKPRTLFPRDGRRERRRLAARASERASDGDAGDRENDDVLPPRRRSRPPPRQYRRPRAREEPPRRLGRRPRVPCHQRGPGKSLTSARLRSTPLLSSDIPVFVVSC